MQLKQILLISTIFCFQKLNFPITLEEYFKNILTKNFSREIDSSYRIECKDPDFIEWDIIPHNSQLTVWQTILLDATHGNLNDLLQYISDRINFKKFYLFNNIISIHSAQELLKYWNSFLENNTNNRALILKLLLKHLGKFEMREIFELV